MSLLNTIDGYLNKNNDDYYPNDKDWVLFVKDRRSTILEEATIIQVDASSMGIYKYSVEALLKENNIPVSAAWILIWINQLDSAMNFNESISELIVPAHATIRKLKKEFIDVRTYQKKTVISQK